MLGKEIRNFKLLTIVIRKIISTLVRIYYHGKTIYDNLYTKKVLKTRDFFKKIKSYILRKILPSKISYLSRRKFWNYYCSKTVYLKSEFYTCV